MKKNLNININEYVLTFLEGKTSHHEWILLFRTIPLAHHPITNEERQRLKKFEGKSRK